jgi:hypothetical protein
MKSTRTTWRPTKMIIPLLALLLLFSAAATVYAHGVVITYNLKTNGEVELYAEFDTGEVMAEAQVTIFSPADPMTPWLTGVADADGKYVFVIDPEIPGLWEIQYRKAGHGDVVNMQLDAGMVDPALLPQPPGELLGETAAAPAPAPAPQPASGGSQATVLSSGGNIGASGASPRCRSC